MHGRFIGTIVALGLSAAPALAQTPSPEPTPTPEPTPPCEVSEQFVKLGIEGKQEQFAPEPVPSVGHDIQEVPYNEESVTRFQYRADVSGSATKPFANRATVELTLSWDNDTDFDLYAYDADGNLLDSSVSFNPLDGSGELLTLFDTSHCTDLRVDVVNYLGLPTSALVLDAKLKSLKP